MGRGNAKSITGHSDNQVIEDNYIDPIGRVKEARRLKVFPNEIEREQEM
jgi:hypothetical protein